MNETSDSVCPDCAGESEKIPTPPDIPGAHAVFPANGKAAHTPGGENNPILIRSRPHILSFANRYLLAFTPVFLVAISVFTRTALGDSVQGLIPKMPGTLATIMPGTSDLSLITVFLVAPVFLFILVASIGYELRLTEAWTSTLIAFASSIAVGFVLTFAAPGTAPDTSQLLRFLQWTAYLVQPFSLLATILVIAGVEKYRRSISYTITESGVFLTSGLWGRREQMIPVQMIGRVESDQGMLGRWFNFGTVIPRSVTGWDHGTVHGGRGVMGGAGIRDTFGNPAGSSGPADCLYGIPDPDASEQILIQTIAGAKNH